MLAYFAKYVVAWWIWKFSAIFEVSGAQNAGAPLSHTWIETLTLAGTAFGFGD